MSSKFNEKIENGKNKYFLQMGKRGKVIVEECIDSENDDIKCYDYPLKKEWLCNDGCSTFEDEFDRLYPEEVHDAMSDDEIEKAGDDIIEKCRLKNCNNCDCESCNGVCDGNINEYISILPTISYGSQLIYLGQFISLTECRNYLSDFSL